MLPDIVLLAAGRSSRMGEPKGLWAIGGKPWLEHQLDAIEALGAETVLVLGFDRQRYLEVLLDLEDRASVVVNPAPEHGPFSSLQCGLRVSGAPAFVLPVDVPVPVTAVWQALHGALTERCDAAVPIHEGLGGHPVLLSPALVTHVLSLPADSRLDHVLRDWGRGPDPGRDSGDTSRIARVPVLDRRVRLNLNAPEDWGKLAAGQ